MYLSLLNADKLKTFCKTTNMLEIKREQPWILTTLVPEAVTLRCSVKKAEVFSCEICKIFKNAFLYRTRLVAASRNISWTLFLLYFRTMNGVTSWYVWVLQRLFHSVACIPFISISFSFSYFFSWVLLFFGFEVSLSILKIKQWSCF